MRAMDVSLDEAYRCASDKKQFEQYLANPQ
jgi:hypothetical protein